MNTYGFVPNEEEVEFILNLASLGARVYADDAATVRREAEGGGQDFTRLAEQFDRQERQALDLIEKIQGEGETAR